MAGAARETGHHCVTSVVTLATPGKVAHSLLFLFLLGRSLLNPLFLFGVGVGREAGRLTFEELVSKAAQKLLPTVASSGLTSSLFSAYSPDGNQGPCGWDQRPVCVYTPGGATVAWPAHTAPLLVPRRCFLSEINVLTIAQPSCKGSFQNYPGT